MEKCPNCGSKSVRNGKCFNCGREVKRESSIDTSPVFSTIVTGIDWGSNDGGSNDCGGCE